MGRRTSTVSIDRVVPADARLVFASLWIGSKERAGQ
jgi:hypothetical protein